MQLNVGALGRVFLACAAIFPGIGWAQGDCTPPAALSVPDGNAASEDELLQTAAALQTYREALAVYRLCLQTEETALGDGATPAQKAAILDSFNASVAQEEGVVGAWNEALRAFKARQN